MKKEEKLTLDMLTQRVRKLIPGELINDLASYEDNLTCQLTVEKFSTKQYVTKCFISDLRAIDTFLTAINNNDKNNFRCDNYTTDCEKQSSFCPAQCESFIIDKFDWLIKGLSMILQQQSEIQWIAPNKKQPKVQSCQNNNIITLTRTIEFLIYLQRERIKTVK